MRFKYLFLPALLLVSLNLLYAQSDESATNADTKELTAQSAGDLNQGSSLFPKEKAAPSKEIVQNKTVNKTSNGAEIIEHTNLKTENPNVFFFNVDFLWWRAKGNGWTFAELYNFNLDIEHTALLSVDYFRGNSDWNPGARVEVGFSTPLEWNIGGIYTYYHNQSVALKRNTGLQAGDEVFLIDLAKSKFNLDYNIFDLELTSLCYWHKYLIVKSIIGARGAWIKYSYRTEWNLFAYNLDMLTTIRNQYKAGGPRMGVDVFFVVGNGFDFFGGITAALLYGHVDAGYSNTVTGSPPFPQIDKFTDLKGTLQMQIGANWKCYFDNHTKAFSLRLLWENNYWIDLGDDYRKIGIHSPETLFTYGLNFGCGFEF